MLIDRKYITVRAMAGSKFGLRWKMVALVSVPVLAIFLIVGAISWQYSEHQLDMMRAEVATDPDVLESIDELIRLRTVLLVVSTTLVGLGLGAIALWSGQFLRPLEQLITAARQISAGDLDTIVQPVGTDEVRDLAHALEAMRVRLLDTLVRIARQAQLEARLQSQARHNKELSILADELRVLARIGEALNRARTAEGTLQLVSSEAAKLVGQEQCEIILVEPDGKTLRIVTWLGADNAEAQKFIERRLPIAEGTFAHSILRGEIVEITDTAADPRPQGDFTDNAPTQHTNVPLKTEDKVIGVIALSGLPPNDQARRMLLALADLAAVAIEKARLHERTQLLAITDDLTGLYNRRGFLELAQREFERARRFHRPLAALMFDLDFFKNVNDTYGHAAGNEILVELTSLTRREMRDVDLVGRTGGDEFIALLPETAQEGVQQAAERFRQAVGETVFTTGHGPVRITVSVGVVILDDSHQDLAQMIDQADQALYAAKQGGRNRVALRPE